ncbi:LOW QUALITY PROTEIN: nuclear RNA export factor 1-like [Dugong dugon]
MRQARLGPTTLSRAHPLPLPTILRIKMDEGWVLQCGTVSTANQNPLRSQSFVILTPRSANSAHAYTYLEGSETVSSSPPLSFIPPQGPVVYYFCLQNRRRIERSARNADLDPLRCPRSPSSALPFRQTPHASSPASRKIRADTHSQPGRSGSPPPEPSISCTKRMGVGERRVENPVLDPLWSLPSATPTPIRAHQPATVGGRVTVSSDLQLQFTPAVRQENRDRSFHYEKMKAQFFVKKASIAFALKKVSGKIWDEENERTSIFVSPSTVPHSEQKELKSTKVKLIKKTNIKGYEVTQQALDLQRLHSDPGMTESSNSRADVMTHGIEMGPNLRTCVAASLHIHEENMPKLLSFNSSNNTPYQLIGLPDTMQKAPNIKSLNLSKNESEGELDKVKGLEPEEMCADRNPLCNTFPDKSTNISSVLELFPKLLCLDDHEVPPSIIFGIEAYKKLPVCKGSVFGSETLKNLILQFIPYYWIYDYGDQQGLLDAYHKACFSLTIPFNPEDPAP